MSFVLMVMAKEALVPPRWVSTDLIGPFERRFILYFLQYLIYWLFKQRVDQLNPHG